MKFNPKSEALAFLIWAHARRIGWDCTIADLADALDENINRVRAVVVLKKWTGRLRVADKYTSDRIASRGNLLVSEVSDQARALAFDVEHGIPL